MPPEHPNLSRVRNARSALVMAKRFLDAEIRRAMAERPAGRVYSAEDVAKAATVSRARVYQILDEAEEKAA